MRTDGERDSDREEATQNTDVQFRGFHRTLQGIKTLNGSAGTHCRYAL